MRKSLTKYFIQILIIFFMQASIFAQELPVAVGSDDTFGLGGAYDGTNFLWTMVTVTNGQYNISGQLIGPGPVLTGNRISYGISGSGTRVDFDGTNYLMAYTDPFPFFASGDTNGWGNLYAQFLNTSGQKVGTAFQIESGVNLKFGQGRGSLSFNGDNYLITYLKGGHHVDILYGQIINKSGNLVGNPVPISSNYARDHSISFDGTNYLVAWCEGSGVDEVIYGQFISATGQLVGSNFVIDGSTNKSDNPLAMSYDGNQYFVLFMEQAGNDGIWNIYGRIVSKAGVVSSNKILVCDSTKSPMAPSIAFDGTEYLITWIQFKEAVNIWGRFFDKNGSPLASEVLLFDTLGGKWALGGVGGYIPGHFILGANRFDPQFQDGDLYVRGLEPLTPVNVVDNKYIPAEFELYQNYPNPFNPSTKISYNLAYESKVRISIYNLLGQEIRELVDNVESEGTHVLNFNAVNLASGIYFYKISAISTNGNKSFTDTKKLILMK